MASPAGTPPNESWNPIHWEHDLSEAAKAQHEMESSNENSQPGSAGGPRPRQKKRVGFGGPGSAEGSPRVSWYGPENDVSPPRRPSPASESLDQDDASTSRHYRSDSEDMLAPPEISKSHLPALSPQQTREIHQAFGQSLEIPKPRPAIRRSISDQPHVTEDDLDGSDHDGQRAHRESRMREAFERGKRLEQDERSAPSSRQNSPMRGRSRNDVLGFETNNIPLQDLGKAYEDGSDSEDGDDEDLEMPALKRTRAMAQHEAQKLVRRHNNRHRRFQDNAAISRPQSGAVTPTDEQEYTQDYRPRPDQYRGGILGALLKLYDNPHDGSHSRSSSMVSLMRRRPSSRDSSAAPTPQSSPPGSGTVTPTNGSASPRPLFSRKKHGSSTSLASLVGTTAGLATPAVSGLGEQVSQRLKEQKAQKEQDRRGSLIKSYSSNAINKVRRNPRLEDEIRITVHIAETIARQRYLQLLCKALMQYGAPTHRLEEYMRMSARVLSIDAQFLYIPGSMIMSFDDASTHTTEVKLVKTSQGLDLGKLRDVHEIYKDVVHDRVGVEEATGRLNEVFKKPPKHSRWLRIPVYGLAAVCVGPFAFQARLIDLPIAFMLGCILGTLQLVVAPRSDLYANVFEIAAAVITSFLARAFGSIPYGDGRLFCFSALAQSSIALILPGYIVLCAALELQSKSIVAGSVRMVYAVIYSLFLGFGITIGTAIYGIIDNNASSETTCSNPIGHFWFFFFVPGFTICLIIINQAKWEQAPVMLVIAFAGYVVSYFSSKRFTGNTQVSNALGALAIGVLANFYSRVGSRVENWALDRWEDDLRPYWKSFRRYVFGVHGKKHSAKKLEEGEARDDESVFLRSTRRVGYSLAAAAMLPAIFVQVPSGLSVQGSLVSGIASANQIAYNNASDGSTVVNSTTITAGANGALNSIAFNVSYSVIQVAIGITVGLFMSAIIVYPVGKKRSGLFSL